MKHRITNIRAELTISYTMTLENVGQVTERGHQQHRVQPETLMVRYRNGERGPIAIYGRRILKSGELGAQVHVGVFGEVVEEARPWLEPILKHVATLARMDAQDAYDTTRGALAKPQELGK